MLLLEHYISIFSSYFHEWELICGRNFIQVVLSSGVLPQALSAAETCHGMRQLYYQHIFNINGSPYRRGQDTRVRGISSEWCSFSNNTNMRDMFRLCPFATLNQISFENISLTMHCHYMVYYRSLCDCVFGECSSISAL